MTTTPLMNLVLPTEGGSADVWAAILDTVFGLVDGHDHTPGKGGKVPSGGLNINADVSWSSGGVSRAITDLRAIDFSPQPAAGVTALAGAFFLSDGTGGLTVNELYYRTTAGTNVKVTNGSALNVAGFSGGIGGDYSAAGALVDFDDATDSYRMRQQVGAAVRQFARVQSADLDLFEFKANPAAGVPANRIRLQSPAALAASYALTLPGSLPASGRATPVVDSSGAMTFVGTLTMYPATLALPELVSSFNVSHTLTIGNNGQSALPITIQPGATFSAWRVYCIKQSSAASTITAQLIETNLVTSSNTNIGAAQTNSANAPLGIQLTGAGVTAAADRAYSIIISGGVNSSIDTVTGWSVSA